MTPANRLRPAIPATSRPPQPSTAAATPEKPAAAGDEMVCTLCGLRACWTG